MRTYISVFSLVLMAGCAGQVTDGDEQQLAEDPTHEEVLPDGTRRTDWDAESVDDETKSTHLWIVNRALDLLAQRRNVPQIDHVVTLMQSSDCLHNWHQGLVDADFKGAYNGGHWDVAVGGSSLALIAAGATWVGHFYDPDTGLNYQGNKNPVAYTEALKHLDNTRSMLAANNRTGACYELGLSLHYMTDITQPMHASNYTAKSWPLKLHSDVEGYASTKQAAWAVHSWTGPGTGDAPTNLTAIAHASKARWPTLKAAIAASFGARCSNFDSYYLDHTDCWQNDAAVDAQLAIELGAAQTATATYLSVLALP